MQPSTSPSPSDDPGALEAWALRRPRLANGLLILAAVIPRIALWVGASQRLHLPFRDLSLLFDGHLYILIARTMPTPYAGASDLFPRLPNPGFISGWFPGYPMVIASINSLLGDIRLATLFASLLSGVVATLIVRRVASEIGPRPMFTALVFAVFPASWLLSSSLPLADSLLVAFAAATVWAVLRGRVWTAIALAAAAVITQKAGVLVPVIAAIASLRGLLIRDLVSASRFLLSFASLVVLQLWLWWLLGDPFANFSAQSWAFGLEEGGLGLTWPGGYLLRGFLDAGPLFVQQRWATAIILAFYLGALVLALRSDNPRTRITLSAWIGIPLLFFSVLASPWPYLSLWRFMTISAPAAVCVYCALAPAKRFRTVPSLLVILGLAALSIASGIQRSYDAGVLLDRVYDRDHFRIFKQLVVEPGESD
ncbi:MAG: hypothetical protein K8J08_22530 [Thermoanaerobaculia bacterium]|nr:hypothetical protein [Thermoanaerobaculia bacterium]